MQAPVPEGEEGGNRQLPALMLVVIIELGGFEVLGHSDPVPIPVALGSHFRGQH